MLKGQRRFEVSYDGDPDLQPIRTFESATLVRVAHRLSTLINTQVNHGIFSQFFNNGHKFNYANSRQCMLAMCSYGTLN